jgi:predicted GIY-YIG superfamily endonuclease
MGGDDGIVVHMPWIYILRCFDDSLYVGHTDNVPARVASHNDGHASRYTSQRRPVTVVHTEHYVSLTRALARERQLKGWTANKKEALIAGDSRTLKSLARRRRR